jgi:hypothetical protein
MEHVEPNLCYAQLYKLRQPLPLQIEQMMDFQLSVSHNYEFQQSNLEILVLIIYQL